MNFTELRELYHNTLVDDVIPWWLRHGIDKDGGINTVIADDGNVINRDRWNWSQWRAVWVFSKLYNRIERREEWLNIAKGIYNFVTRTGRLENGHWPLLLDGDGSIKRGYESIYVDGFAIYGLTELYRATGDRQVLDLALQTAEAVEKALAGDQSPPAYPYPIPPGWINHGISMCFSINDFELAEASGAVFVREALQRYHRNVMEVFLRPDRGLVFEWLLRDGTEAPPPEGRAVVPGHAIESMWFQMHIARAANDRATIDRAIKVIRDHLERGWDPKYGGLFLAIDADGNEPIGWGHAEKKLWWPHTEALYATLLAYEYCGESWCLEWHKKIREWSWAHYPVREHGEWRQKLTREGNVITDTLWLPVKDPFHLPRALIYLVDVLDRLIEKPAKSATEEA